MLPMERFQSAYRAFIILARCPATSQRMPGDAAPLELRRAPGADGSLEVPGLPPNPAEVVLRAGDGREIRRETVKPAGE